MADISIQFYALPSELLTFSKEVSEIFGLHLVAMRFFPFEAVEIETTNLARVFEQTAPYSRLAFTVNAPTMPVAHELDFADKNATHLRLQIGRETESGLEESWLTARTENRKALQIWRKISNRLKKRTKVGVTAINRQTGESGFYKSGRYTAGAKELEASGVAMLPPQGPNGPRIVLGMADPAP